MSENLSGQGAWSNFQLADAIEMLERRKWWLVLGAAVGLTLGVAAYLLLPASYESTTTVLVEPQEVPKSYIESTITVSFRNRLDTLAERVTSFDSLNALIDRVGPERLDPAGDDSREELMDEIRSNLVIDKGRKESTVFRLSYTAATGELAALVVREITQSFIDENLKDRNQQAAETAEFLNQELANLREQVAAQEERIREFRFERMGSLPSQLEANLRSLDRMNLELASNLESQVAVSQRIALLRRQFEEAATAAPTRAGSPSDLRTLLVTARRELMEAELVYTDEHPKVQQLRTEIATLERRMAEQPTTGVPKDLRLLAPGTMALQGEIERAGLNLKALKREEQRIREKTAEFQARVEETPQREEEFTGLTRDYKNLTDTYQDLLAKKYEAMLALNLELASKGERFKLLQPARVPDAPSWPDATLLLPGGLALGLFLAAFCVGIAELRSPAFRSVSRLARVLGLPVFASIPSIDNADIYEEPPDGEVDPKIVVHTAPESAPAEQYRGFLPVILDAEDCQVILVTSAARGDGKSLTCMNLATSLASDLNRRVLVIDSDLRRPSAHRLLRISRRRGLSDILLGQATLAECATNSKIPNLTLLPAGPAVRRPLTLLTGRTFLELLEEARKGYDLVVIDCPPLLPVVDTKILRRMADMVLFVVRADATPPDAVIRSLGELKGCAGVVFNGVSPGSFRRHYYYDAYSRYAYGDDAVEDALEREGENG